MTAISRIGILGLGKMGAPMAGHLLARGYSVAGYDPLEPARRNARALGVSVCETPREVAQASELVIVVVGFDHEVEAALFGSDGIVSAARPGLIVALGSTVAPRYATRLAGRLRDIGIVLLDVPLARGEAAAAAGKLLIYGAGEEASFEACRPAFATFPAAAPVRSLLAVTSWPAVASRVSSDAPRRAVGCDGHFRRRVAARPRNRSPSHRVLGS